MSEKATEREDLAVGSLIDQVGAWFPGDAGLAIAVLSRAIETIAEGASRYAAERQGEFEHGTDHCLGELSKTAESGERSVVICACARLIRARLPERKEKTP